MTRLLCQNLIIQSKFNLPYLLSFIQKTGAELRYFNLLQSLCFLATVGAIVSAEATKTV